MKVNLFHRFFATKNMKRSYLLLVLISVLLLSCSKEELTIQPTKQASVSLDVRQYDKWIYFSFLNGIIETPVNPEESLVWDIAFHRWDVKTNGGIAGKGNGSAYMSELTSLDKNLIITNMQESQFKSNVLIKTYMKTPDMTQGPEQRVDVPANPELCKWMVVNMSTIPPGYNMSDKVFLVKSASGRLGAIKFKSYMNETAVKGYVTFEYLYPIN